MARTQTDVATLSMMAVLSASGPLVVGRAFAATAYDPVAHFDIKVSEVELRSNKAGRSLMARIYQPAGPGPFPRCSIFMAARGTPKRTTPRNRLPAR